MEIDVDGRLREEKAADAAADEHGDETEREERSGGDANVGAIEAAKPDERHDRGWNRDGECRERKQQGREGIHTAHEHVVSPNHVAQEATIMTLIWLGSLYGANI